MMQGDACHLGIRIHNNAGNPVTPEDIRDLEIVMGHLRKTLGNAQLHYQNGLWLFPLTQVESRSLWPSRVRCQVRVLWPNGVVEGHEIPDIRIRESISKEVL